NTAAVIATCVVASAATTAGGPFASSVKRRTLGGSLPGGWEGKGGSRSGRQKTSDRGQGASRPGRLRGGRRRGSGGAKPAAHAAAASSRGAGLWSTTHATARTPTTE